LITYRHVFHSGNWGLLNLRGIHGGSTLEGFLVLGGPGGGWGRDGTLHLPDSHAFCISSGHAGLAVFLRNNSPRRN
jgi:hypothetical protein